jgi:hypothetical protein
MIPLEHMTGGLSFSPKAGRRRGRSWIHSSGSSTGSWRKIRFSRPSSSTPFWTIQGTESEMLKVEDHDGPDSRRVVRRY